MTERQLDREALLLALKITEEKAEEGLWDQENWLTQTKCGTAGCFAGNWALHQGCQIKGNDYEDYWKVITPDGTPVSVPDFVMDDLGLTDCQAANLFWGSNSLDDLRRIVAGIVESDEPDL